MSALPPSHVLRNPPASQIRRRNSYPRPPPSFLQSLEVPISPQTRCLHSLRSPLSIGLNSICFLLPPLTFFCSYSLPPTGVISSIQLSFPLILLFMSIISFPLLMDGRNTLFGTLFTLSLLFSMGGLSTLSSMFTAVLSLFLLVLAYRSLIRGKIQTTFSSSLKTLLSSLTLLYKKMYILCSSLYFPIIGLLCIVLSSFLLVYSIFFSPKISLKIILLFSLVFYYQLFPTALVFTMVPSTVLLLSTSLLTSFKTESYHLASSFELLSSILPTLSTSWSLIQGSKYLSTNISDLIWTVTEQERSNEILKQENFSLTEASEKAKSELKSKSTLLSSMSKELRTNMYGLLGTLNLLSGTTLQPDQEEYSKTLEKTGERILSLVDDVLTFSRLQDQQVQLESVAFDLEGLIEQVIGETGQHLQEKVELCYTIEDEVPLNLIGDPSQLIVILSHLVGNAVKFTHKGEVVLSVSIRKTPPPNIGKQFGRRNSGSGGGLALPLLKLPDVTEREKGNIWLNFEINDTGIGISEETLKKLFHPFSLTNSEIYRHYGGTGLGLAVCKKLADLFGGELSVTSVLNKGTQFCFSVPFLPSPFCKTSTTSSLSPSSSFLSLSLPFTSHNEQLAVSLFSSLSVLVVDDNENVQSCVSRILRQWGCEVQIEGEWEGALQKIRGKNKLDLLILDHTLPEVTTEESLKQIRDSRKEKLPVVVMIHPSKRDEMPSHIDSPAIITKPVRKQKLLDVLVNKMEFGRRRLSVELANDVVEQINKDRAEKSEEGLQKFETGEKMSNDSRIGPCETEVGSETEVKQKIQYNEEEFCLNVLVAEDHTVNQKILKSFIERAGHRCAIAENGRGAVNLWEREKRTEDQDNVTEEEREISKGFDVILMDCHMPVVDGWEATKLIRQKEREVEQFLGKNEDATRKTIIIALTGDTEARDLCLESGMDDYLPKPVQKQALQGLLNKIYQKKKDIILSSNKYKKRKNSVPQFTNLIAPYPAPKAVSPRVLLVEDNAVNARIGVAVLKKHDFNVELAIHGKMALDLFTSSFSPSTFTVGYDIILMDIHMPVMDGIGCTQLIRKFERENNLPHIPIIALTADTEPGQKALCLEIGCTEYVSKPIDYPHLVTLLKRYTLSSLNSFQR